MRWIRDRLSNQAGFTLVELMISISLLGVVVGPITGSFLIGMLESTATGDRVVDSSGAQAVAAYLVSDIQSSQEVDTTSTCLPAEVAGGTVLLGLTWDDVYDGDAVDDSARIAYVDLPTASGQHQLYRAECPASGSDSVSLLVQNLAATGGLVAECDGGPCAAATPAVVAVDLTVESDAAQAGSSYGAWTFSFEAARKVTS